MRRQLALPGEIVKKSNALARARWSVSSIWEPRLVALVASKVKMEDDDFQTYEIPIDEFIKKSGKHAGGRTYIEISKTVDNLMGRVLTINDEDGKGWTKYNVFSCCRYRAEDNTLEVRFDPDLKPHYLGLKEKFAQYNLIEFLLLPSIYSQRLFEILKSWDNTSEVTIQLTDLYEMLEAPQSVRKDFSQFRLRILDKAKNDITKNTTLLFEWEPIRRGKVVYAIRFIFKKAVVRKIENKKKSIEDKKHGERQTKLFLAAVECAKSKHARCTSPDNTKAICAVCRRICAAQHAEAQP